MLMSLVPSPTFEVLHFLRHAAIHFAAQGLNLRDLCDWTLLVTHVPEADWDVVRTEIERFGMGTFVAALDGVTRARLGVASPLHLDISDDMVRRLEDDILRGRPNKEGYRTYFHSHWKRQMAFGDTPISLVCHKIISYLSHKTKHPAS